jgi:hypothetical protein
VQGQNSRKSSFIRIIFVSVLLVAEYTSLVLVELSARALRAFVFLSSFTRKTIVASLILPAILRILIHIEKTPQKKPVAKIIQFNNATAGGTVNLNVS